MATAKEIRRENLKVLVERFGSMKSLNERLGRKDNTLTQILNASIHSETGKKKQMGDRLARSIEQTLSLGDGWMDADHSADPNAKSNLIALNKLSIAGILWNQQSIQVISSSLTLMTTILLKKASSASIMALASCSSVYKCYLSGLSLFPTTNCTTLLF